MGIVFLIVGLGIGAGVAFFFPIAKGEADFQKASENLEKAHKEAQKIREENQEKIKTMEQALLAEEKSMEESFAQLEKVVEQKEEILKRKEERNRTHEEQVEALRLALQNHQKKQAELQEAALSQVSKKSGLTREEALKQAQNNLEHLIQDQAERRKNAELEEIEEDAPRHAKAILQVVIQRLGVPSSVDHNPTSVTVKDDKFKGLLIGKNGSNVEYLESLLPVSLIFNLGDPETIHVGGVNLLRRNIAKLAVEKLQKEAKKAGSISHEMIQKAVEESEKEIMSLCDHKGMESLKLLGLKPEETPPDLQNYVGRLYFRTSYGQNITGHSNEMAFAARMLSDLIGADTKVAMQAAFYHDIGKAIDHDVGGAHDDLSKEILEKHNYDPRIVHAAYAHHDKVPCIAPEDFLVKAVDAISGGRPGARQESVSNYFERIQKLEEAALSFEGVNKVLAMSAGRELRILVDWDRIEDAAMQDLADNIAGKIEEEVAFPGVIKVNLIRLSKAVDYAREQAGASQRRAKAPTRQGH